MAGYIIDSDNKKMARYVETVRDSMLRQIAEAKRAGKDSIEFSTLITTDGEGAIFPEEFLAEHGVAKEQLPRVTDARDITDLFALLDDALTATGLEVDHWPYELLQGTEGSLYARYSLEQLKVSW